MKIDFFEHLLKDQPLVLIDVGAAGGIQEKWKCLEPFLHVISFEPDKRSPVSLSLKSGEYTEKHSATTFLSVGLHNKKSRIPLYLTRVKTDSSILEPNFSFLKRFPHSDRFEVIGREMMDVDTLDNQLDEHKIIDVDFIKVDTQGSELFVLEGSKHALRLAFGVEIEVEFSPIYLNQPLFADVDILMRSYGFQLFDIAPGFWKRKIGKNLGGERGQIMFANILYFMDAEMFVHSTYRFDDNTLRRSKILRAITICLLHGYADYAREIADIAHDMFTSKEYESLVSSIIEKGKPQSPIPHFLGRATLSSFFLRIGNLLKPASHNWQQARSDVGNF